MGKTEESHYVSPWTFGLPDRLEKALRVARVSNGEMADALGVSANTIGNYTSGRTAPSKLQVREWAMRTGAPLRWLEEGVLDEDSPRPGSGAGKRNFYFGVGPAGLEPTASTVESRRFDDGHVAPVTPIFGERAS